MRRRAATLPSYLAGQFSRKGADSALHTATGLSHRYPPRLRFRLLRDHDFQHAVSTRRIHVLGIRGVRQDEAAMEAPEPTLDSLLLRLFHAVGSQSFLLCPVSRYRQDSVVQGDLNI